MKFVKVICKLFSIDLFDDSLKMDQMLLMILSS